MAYFDSHGVKIYYEEHGSGDPVVLVHGFASRSEHNWGITQWYATLSPHYRVIAMDCRGHGKSGKPHDTAAYGGDTMGDDVIGLLDHLGIKRTRLMGYSMGSRISMGLLLSHPERLRAVVLGGVGASGGARDPEGRKAIVAALLAKDASAVKDEIPRQFRQFAEAAGNDLEALAACMGAFRNESNLAQFSKVKVPVLIVVGTKDTLVGSAQPLQALIPGSQLLELEGRDHLNAPGDDLYKEAVLKFFKAAPA